MQLGGPVTHAGCCHGGRTVDASQGMLFTLLFADTLSKLPTTRQSLLSDVFNLTTRSDDAPAAFGQRGRKAKLALAAALGIGRGASTRC